MGGGWEPLLLPILPETWMVTPVLGAFPQACAEGPLASMSQAGVTQAQHTWTGTWPQPGVSFRRAV